MAKELGYSLSAIYALGIIAVQSHLLRFGILDISPIDVYYFLVGFGVLVCIAPGVAVSVILDLRLRAEHLYAKVALGLVLLILVVGAFFLARFEYNELIFNFNSYPYAKRYMVRNVTAINLSILIIWLILATARRYWCSFYVTNKALFFTGAFAVLIFAVFFGRSIYPALDRGVGGGAPQFARLLLEGKSPQNEVRVLLVHAGEDFIYFLELDAFPFKDGEQPLPLHRYVTVNCSGPVYRALVENEVVKLPVATVMRITTIGFNQRRNIEKYLPCKAPNPTARGDC